MHKAHHQNVHDQDRPGLSSLIELQQIVRQHARTGLTQTTLPNLTLFCSSAATDPVQTIYEPSLCLVVNGARLAMVGPASFLYNTGQYLLVSVNLPLVGAIMRASEDDPYLGLKLNLDLDRLRSLILELPDRAVTSKPTSGLTSGTLTPDLTDALVRLARLLSRPEDIAILGPSIEREILYRLITGENGDLLRQLATTDSRLFHINRAMDWIRQHYRETFRIETLAEMLGMSVSSFHHHFKAVTSMSPLQYQKHIRLHEARKLVLSNQMDAMVAGFQVGYDSPSQFSREYKRIFGAPPLRDVARFRKLSELGPQAAE